MKDLPDQIIMYQLDKDFHIHRLTVRDIRNLFIYYFSKIKRVPTLKEKCYSLPETLFFDIKNKVKSCKKIDDNDWVNYKNYFIYDRKFSDKKLLKTQINELTNCKTAKMKRNMLKKFMGRFSVICPLFHPVKLIVYTSSHLNKQKDKIHRCSKSEIIIPVGCFIVFSGSLVHGGSKYFVQEKGEYPSCIRLFFTIAEKNTIIMFMN